MPSDRPIIFSGPMVRALLDGRKTQTRRLATSPLARAEPGDRLWVRESWYCDHIDCQRGPYLAPDGMAQAELRESGFLYYGTDDRHIWECGVPPFRPSIHMPRWASRLTLTVERVWRHPLNLISDSNAIAEGIEVLRESREGGPLYRNYMADGLGDRSARYSYATLWAMLHGWESWRANPEVVAIEFSVGEGNIDGFAIREDG